MLQLTTILFLITFSLLAVLHTVASKLFLYWHFWWFDIPMHAFGGIIVSLGLFTLRDLHIFPNRLLKLLPVLSIVVLIALVWEGFELIIGTEMLSDYFVDTITDLCMGLLGGYIGFHVGNSLRNLR